MNNPPTRAALARSGRPRSNIGFRSSTLSLMFRRWFRLMSVEIPVLVYVSGCAEGNNVTSARCLESLNWVGLAVVIDLSKTKARDWVPHKFFSNKRCRREFGSWYMNGAVEPPRSLFPKLPFESCWDLIRCADPTRMAIWQTSPLSSTCLFQIRFLDAFVSVMFLRACATLWRIFRA